MRPQGVALDIGCGRGAHVEDGVRVRRELRRLKPSASHVIGIDVDPTAKNNPTIDEFHLINGERWPVGDSSVDLAVADWVIEHVASPAAFFAEAFRVLKPGGCLCLRTSNAWNYVGIIARLVPNSMHARVLGATGHDRDAQDVFPTYHRCNSPGKLQRALRTAGFRAVAYGYEAEPDYLHFSKLFYGLGVLHQRLAPRIIRSAIFAFGEKPLLQTNGARA